MPGAWRDCLEGKGSVDLSGCTVASEHVYLWSTGKLSSRLAGLMAGRLMRGRVENLGPGERPPPFDDAGFRGQLYRLDDFVLDVPSLLQHLARPHHEAIFAIDWSSASLGNHNGLAQLHLPGLRVNPRRLLLCAGEGNAGLLQALGCNAPTMQIRPLTQVLVKHRYSQPLFGHCLGAGASPRLTVSTHKAPDGDSVWYLGGDLATAAGLNSEQRINRAREELRSTLPWLALGESQWRSITLRRAEPAQARLRKPDTGFLEAAAGPDNTLVAWPTKLALCPALGDALLQQLDQDGFEPRFKPDLSPLAELGPAGIAQPCWENLYR